MPWATLLDTQKSALHVERLRGLPGQSTFAELSYNNVRVSVDFGVAIRPDTPAPVGRDQPRAATTKASTERRERWLMGPVHRFS